MATKKTKQSMRADLAAVDALANKMRRDPKLRAGYEALLAEDDGEAELREMALRQRIETLESELRDRNDVILEAEGDLGVERAKLAYAKETLSLVASALWREGLAAAEHDARRAVPMTRSRVDQMTPAELAIREAMLAVEAAGADERLTQAVCLLHEASAKVYAYALDRESKSRTVACVVLGEPWSAVAAPDETFGSLRSRALAAVGSTKAPDEVEIFDQRGRRREPEHLVDEHVERVYFSEPVGLGG